MDEENRIPPTIHDLNNPEIDLFNKDFNLKNSQEFFFD